MELPIPFWLLVWHHLKSSSVDIFACIALQIPQILRGLRMWLARWKKTNENQLSSWWFGARLLAVSHLRSGTQGSNPQTTNANHERRLALCCSACAINSWPSVKKPSNGSNPHQTVQSQTPMAMPKQSMYAIFARFYLANWSNVGMYCTPYMDCLGRETLFNRAPFLLVNPSTFGKAGTSKRVSAPNRKFNTVA